MTTAIVLHRVADYEAWRPVYDALDDTREAAGVTHQEVLRSQDDTDFGIQLVDVSRAQADVLQPRILGEAVRLADQPEEVGPVPVGVEQGADMAIAGGIRLP